MAPASESSFLFPRVDEPSTSSGLSPSTSIGIAVVGVAAAALVVFIAVMWIRRRNRHHTEAGTGDEKILRQMEVQPSIDKEPLPADLQVIEPADSSLSRSFSRRNLTPSVILPYPVPPIPAARPHSPQITSPSVPLKTGTYPSGRPLSSAEIIAHHTANGTTPRAFVPSPSSPTRSTGPFGFALNTSPTRPSFDRTATPKYGSYHTENNSLEVPRPNSGVSFSRISILSASLRNSFSSGSTGVPVGPGADLYKIRQLFTPLLPDELVVRLGEKVTLVQAYDDGWCVVGRKSAFAAKAPASPAGYAFGQGKNAHSVVDSVEIGMVPLWAFEKRGSAKCERPMRSTSLGVTLVLDEGERGGADARDGVISWSNF